MEGVKHLHILWTNADVVTSKLMVFMYATNALSRGWWDKVTVVIWGATAKLAAENKEIQEKITAAAEAGAEISACIACATELGVADKLRELDIEVKPWGPPLTQVIQQGMPLITV